MIEGIKIDVPTVELRDHLRFRADHHATRQQFYLNRANDLTQGIADMDLGDEADAMAFSNSGRGDPRESMRQAARQHGDRLAFFRFLADHLVPDETYRLTEGDLLKIEFASKYL